jgi:hypothetical protein
MTAPRDPVERAEDGLRILYVDRAAAPTAELRARIAAIPTSAPARRFAWLRSPVGVVAVAVGVVVALVAIARIRGLVHLPAQSDVGAVPAPYDPAHPTGGLAAVTGVTFDGISGSVSTILLVALSVILLTVLVRRVWRDLTGRSPSAEPRAGQRLTWRRFVANLAMAVVVVLGFSVVKNLFAVPLGPGSFSGSGLGVTEARDDGIDPFLVKLRPGSVEVTEQPPVSGSSVFDGPRSVYAVAPGRPLTYLVSLRNSWPIGIRLLGRWRDSTAATDATEPTGSTPTGLSLLREPDVVLDAGPDATKPFAPVDLAPGEEVTLVVAEVGRDCADPTKAVPARRDSESFSIPSIEFVYEAFGIEGVARVGLSPEVTVPSNCP